ncbi:MAG: 1-deoxy-D-xylulose-5-phosphate reductoisomerase [Victivallales bacterium]|nr:1-deoxy-D-xylulose-5-phosphate reductoisomerase [Victivallales bacterium]
MKGIAILGCTGSIGVNALRVVQSLARQYRVVGLAAGHRVAELAEQAQFHHPAWVFAQDLPALQRQALPQGTRILENMGQLCEACAAENVDAVLCAISGTGGLRPSLAALEAGKTLALASKEVLVMAGALVTATARRCGGRILPVDSEHCAVFQCLEGNAGRPVQRIILTCSGGPFHHHPEVDLATVTPEMALHHPTWAMGRKITLDSATLMNKGLELIEAGWLFGVSERQLEVVIHPQSIVHSMVEYADHSVLAQLGVADMCLPIHYCLCWPKRQPSITPQLDFTHRLELTFEPPDNRRFPALELARRAMRLGGASGAIFNAANETAVERFLNGTLSFDRIPRMVALALDKLAPASASTLEDLLEADQQARAFVRQT